MSIAKMIALHPDVAGDINDALATAARRAMFCDLMCSSCADACVAEEMDMRQCIRTCRCLRGDGADGGATDRAECRGVARDAGALRRRLHDLRRGMWRP